MRLFHDRNRAAGYLTMLLTLACNFSVFFFVPQFLQEILGYSAVLAAAAFLPLGLAVFAMSRLTPRLLKRFGARPLILAGLGSVAGGVGWLGQLTAGTPYVPVLVTSTALIGIGIGTFLMPLTALILGGVPREDAGTASGVLQTMQQVGGALGLASLVTVYGAAVRHAPAGSHLAPAMAHGMAIALRGGSIFVVCAFLLVLLAVRVPRPALAPARRRRPSSVSVLGIRTQNVMSSTGPPVPWHLRQGLGPGVPLPFAVRPGASPVPRAAATTPSSAASGATSAMKSAEVRLPRAASAPANPTINTATATSPHPCKNSRSVKGGAGAVTSATAVTGLVARRSAMPSRARTMTVRLPGRSAIRSSSSGWAGSGDCDTEPPPTAHDTTLQLPEGRTR